MAEISSNQALSDRRKTQFRNLVAENQSFPLATITYHGPGPEQATKIVVGILLTPEGSPIVRTWSGDDIADDVDCAREISGFIKQHDVARVLTSEWVLSCPHQEGVDYPQGSICPLCPDWH